MTDVVKISDGVVTQVWRNRTAVSVAAEGNAIEDLVEFAPGLVVAGQLWDGETLSNPIIETPRVIDWPANERERLRFEAKSLEDAGDHVGAIKLRLQALEN